VVDLDGRRIDKVLQFDFRYRGGCYEALTAIATATSVAITSGTFAISLAGASSFKQGGTQPGGLGIPQPFPNYPIPLLPHFR
jgi:hypothetical protein